MTDEHSDITGAIITIAILAVLVALFAQCTAARGDYVLHFSEESYCLPCRQQAPVVDLLKKQGYDIRVVKPSERRDLARYYRIRRVPTSVYVIEGPDKLSYDSGRRLTGVTSVEQLRAFCGPVVPIPAHTVITVLGIPVLVW